MKNWLFCISLVFLTVFLNSLLLAQPTIDTRMLVKSNTYNSPSAGTGTLVIEFQLRSNAIPEVVDLLAHIIELDPVLDTQFRAAGSYYTIVAVNSPVPGPADFTNYTLASRYIDFIFFLVPRNWLLTIPGTWYSVAELTIRYSMIANTGTINWSANPFDYSFIALGGSIPGIRVPITPYVVDLGTQDIPLPVELVYFNATENRNGVKLTWQTQRETDLAGFNLWKSDNPETGFVKINPDLIESAGSSTNPCNYTFEDKNVERGKTWYYRLEQVDLDGATAFIFSVQVDVNKLPESVTLYQNFPNPFNPSTDISYDLPEELFVNLSVYNVLGKEVRTLVNENRTAGSHSVIWDGCDQSGLEMSSGIYFYKLQAGEETQVFKLIKVE